MRKIISAAVIELIAVLSAFIRLNGGIMTDEAKYLLNIPYPHPPLARFVLNLLSHFPGHEIFIRLLLATMLLQAVWLIWWAMRDGGGRSRVIACLCWVFSSAVLLQAGTIMMVPLTALFGLFFACMLIVRADRVKSASGWLAFAVGCIWFAGLFTAYQTALYLPLVIAIFVRFKVPYRNAVLYIVLPIILLCLYSLSNPFSIAVMVMVAGKDAGLPLASRFMDLLSLWIVSGGGLLSIAGTVAIIYIRKPDALAALVLVVAYAFLSFQEYYSLLLTPVLMLGAMRISSWIDKAKALPAIGLSIVVVCVSVAFAVPGLFGAMLASGNQARDTIKAVANQTGGALPSGRLLIAGDFGHQWQYYSPYPVIRLTPKLADRDYAVLVCLVDCPDDLKALGRRVENASVETYVRELRIEN